MLPDGMRGSANCELAGSNEQIRAPKLRVDLSSQRSNKVLPIVVVVVIETEQHCLVHNKQARRLNKRERIFHC